MPGILLIEDSPQIAMLKRRTLTAEGFDVRPAANGREALEILDKNPFPDAIVSDLNQREFEGYDLVHVLRGRFHGDLLTATEALERRFKPRIQIALQYAHLRGRRIGDIPLILTSSGPLPPWKRTQMKKDQSFENWMAENAEIDHYERAIQAADAFLVIEPVFEEREGCVASPLKELREMRQLVAELRKRIRYNP